MSVRARAVPVVLLALAGCADSPALTAPVGAAHDERPIHVARFPSAAYPTLQSAIDGRSLAPAATGTPAT